MRSGARCRRGASGQQELPPGRVCVHGATHDIPYLRDLLPLVDQDRAPSVQRLLRLRGDGLADSLRVQTHDGSDALLSRGGPADSLGSVDRDRADLPEQLVELIIQDPAGS